MTPTDEWGRFVWTVTWGRPGRSDWRAVLVVAHDADEALALASRAHPDWFRPHEVFLAGEATARAVLDPDSAEVPVTLPVLRS